jgi:hypothetical protein
MLAAGHTDVEFEESFAAFAFKPHFNWHGTKPSNFRFTSKWQRWSYSGAARLAVTHV